MIDPYLKTSMPVYDDIDRQNHRDECCKDESFVLYTDRNHLPPFEIYIPNINIVGFPIGVQVWDAETDTQIVAPNPTALAIANLIINVFTDGTDTWIIYEGSALGALNMDTGQYYLVITDPLSNEVYYTEVFTVCDCDLIYRNLFDERIGDNSGIFDLTRGILKFIDNPVFYPPTGATTIWDRGFTNSPYFCLNKDGTIYYDGDYYMYYSGTNNVAYATTHPATPTYNDDRIGLAKTTDFINFIRVTGLSGNGDGCVMTWGNGDRGDGTGHYGGNPTIIEGFGYRQGQHTGANNAPQLACAGQTWVVNQFVGLYLVNRTDKCWGTITANGVNSITCAGGFAGGTDNDWDTGDWYDIACWDQYDAQIGTIIYDEGTFRMWFTGNMNTDFKWYRGPGFAAPSDHVNLLYATSPDGEIWTKQIAIIIAYGAGGDDDDDGVYAPFVIWDEDDSKWKMWYIGKRGGAYRAMYATANNPQGPWTKHATTAVYTDAVLGAGLFATNVRKLDNGTYLMVYSGVNQPNDGLRYATSPDGIAWTGHGVFLALGVAGRWDEDVLMWPSYFNIGNSLYIFYRGDNRDTTPGEGPNAGSVEIGLASAPPMTWTMCNHLSLVWWSDCNIFDDIVYEHGYRNRLILDTSIEGPRAEITKSGESKLCETFNEDITHKEFYSFKIRLSKYAFYALNRLPLYADIESGHVVITLPNGDWAEVEDVLIDGEWDVENCFNTFTLEFIQGCLLVTNCCDDTSFSEILEQEQ